MLFEPGMRLQTSALCEHYFRSKANNIFLVAIAMRRVTAFERLLARSLQRSETLKRTLACSAAQGAKPRALNHVAIAVPDIAKAIEQYKNLGLPISQVQALPEHGVKVRTLGLMSGVSNHAPPGPWT